MTKQELNELSDSIYKDVMNKYMESDRCKNRLKDIGNGDPVAIYSAALHEATFISSEITQRILCVILDLDSSS